MKRRSWLGWLPVALSLSFVLIFLLSIGDDPDRAASPLVNKALASFSTEDFNQAADFGVPGRFSSRDFGHGRVGIINVFASWCPPCREEHPWLIDLARDGRAALYGLVYKDNPEAAHAYLTEAQNPFTALGLDAKGRVGLTLGVFGVPETLVVDGAGRLLYHHRGPLTGAVMREVIWPLLPPKVHSPRASPQ